MGVDISGYGNYGWATTKPVKSLADAKPLKFRIAEAAVNQSLYKAWGLNAVVMPWPDVPVALKQGVIDALDHTPMVCNITKKFEVAKSFTQINYAQGLFIHLVNKAWFDGLPADLQKTLVDGGPRGVRQDARAHPGAGGATRSPRRRRRASSSSKLSDADMATLRKEGDTVHQEWAEPDRRRLPEEGAGLPGLQGDVVDSRRGPGRAEATPGPRFVRRDGRMFDRTLRYLDKALTFFEEWSLFLTVIVALATLFVSVLTRYLMTYTMTWPEELVREVIMYTTFVGCATAVKNRSLIRIDAVPNLFPWLKRPLDFVNHAAVRGLRGLRHLLRVAVGEAAVHDEADHHHPAHPAGGPLLDHPPHGHPDDPPPRPGRHRRPAGPAPAQVVPPVSSAPALPRRGHG